MLRGTLYRDMQQKRVGTLSYAVIVCIRCALPIIAVNKITL